MHVKDVLPYGQLQFRCRLLTGAEVRNWGHYSVCWIVLVLVSVLASGPVSTTILYWQSMLRAGS